MNLVHVVALLAVTQFLVFGFLVGRARGKYHIKAPAVSGHELFEREYRVQMNTLEQLICFLPALLIAGQYWSQAFVATMGLVYLIGRVLYRNAYVRDPGSRGPGFALTFVPTVVLVVAGVIGALRAGA